MKSLLIALFLLCSASALAQEAPSNLSHGASKPAVIPFHFTSYDTPFAMQGEFQGEYRVFTNSVEVRLTRAVVRIAMHCPYKGYRQFSALRFILASEKPNGKWDATFKSQKLMFRWVMKPGDTYSFNGDIYLNIPKEATTDLSKFWLVAQMDDHILDTKTGESREGYAMAMSCKDIFSKP